jgi:hypothetical protein
MMMTKYTQRIWASIRTCARDALVALEPHRIWIRTLADPDCGVYRIGESALHDVTVPAEIDALLREVALVVDAHNGEDYLRLWPTVHVLEGLDLIAGSRSRDDVFATRAGVPDQHLLYEGATREEAVYEAMRLGGPDSEPASLLGDLYVIQRDAIIRDLIAWCAFSVEGWVGDLPDGEHTMVSEAWDGVVQDAAALRSFRDDADRTWRLARRLARKTLASLAPHIVWEPLTDDESIATPSFALDAATDPSVPPAFRSLVQDWVIGPPQRWQSLRPHPGQILHALKIVAKTRSEAEAVMQKYIAPPRCLWGHYDRHVPADGAEGGGLEPGAGTRYHVHLVVTAIVLLVRYFEGAERDEARRTVPDTHDEHLDGE